MCHVWSQRNWLKTNVLYRGLNPKVSRKHGLFLTRQRYYPGFMLSSKAVIAGAIMLLFLTLFTSPFFVLFFLKQKDWIVWDGLESERWSERVSGRCSSIWGSHRWVLGEISPAECCWVRLFLIILLFCEIQQKWHFFLYQLS